MGRLTQLRGRGRAFSDFGLGGTPACETFLPPQSRSPHIVGSTLITTWGGQGLSRVARALKGTDERLFHGLASHFQASAADYRQSGMGRCITAL